ncbi:MAG: hypothetical protein HQ551_08740 [Desulfobacteraceae bacterium]|nr:hypothetical protein [Desulfobacteraceae bacterium]
MELKISYLQESLKSIDNLLTEANEILDRYPKLAKPDHDAIPDMQVEYYLESAFIQTLVLLDRLNLSRSYDKFNEIFSKAKEEGLLKIAYGIDEPYLVWSSEIYTYLTAIGNSYNINPFSTKVSSDVISILRATLYSITDKNIFNTSPSNENEVHERIEAVLKCVFPDLKHKPAISKPIKNFIPDTGLPSVRTLIEYKFVKSKEDAKRISDEVLADTRGYFSRDWEKFIYVIYETSRIKQELEWENMLRECGVPENTKIIVLSGEPAE